jgi:cytochrome o ubiquinol oxidase subunit II
MSNKYKAGLGILLAVGIVGMAASRLHGLDIPVLEPRGQVGQKERQLIITAVLLSLVVVIPVYIMLFGFAWKYREGNKKARYDPDFDHSRLFESIWWGVPLILIFILAIITWKSSHDLDPFKPLKSSTPPITIEVVAMEWKWLFIYPKQNIATVNLVQIPVNTPINFEITSDAPMNSFWIPQLGGQIYAMSGMSTHLQLMANNAGDYRGESANISGNGFAGMYFTARASSTTEFDQWVQLVRLTNNPLSTPKYNQLATPTENSPVSYYSTVDSGLYDTIVNKYAEPLFLTPPTRAE